MKSILSVTIICSSYSFEIFIIPWIILSAITFESLSGESIKSLEKQILDQILGRNADRQIYDNRIRPNGSSHGNDGPCEVTVNFLIRSISEISDLDMEYATQLTFREEWLDDRLKYDDQDGQIKYLTLTDPSRIWLPDLFFKNEKEGHFHDIIMPNVLLRIHPDGRVLYSVRISLVLACSMDLKFYPMDNQWCDIIMASYGYTTKDVIFYWQTKEPVQVQMLNLPRFQLSNYTHNYCTSKTITGEYSCIRVELCFKREFSYYLIHIYLPCIMLVIVSWVSFWLDPNAIPARVSLGVTTLLTMATQISSINSSLPPVSYIKAVDVWTEACLTFVFGALLEFALVNYVSRCEAQKAALNRYTAGRNSVLDAQKRWNASSTNNIDFQEGAIFFGMKPMKRKICPGRRQPCMMLPEDGECGTDGSSEDDDELTRWFKWLRKFPTKSKRIDVVSRIFFPAMFSLFNLVYWLTYLSVEEEKKKVGS